MSRKGGGNYVALKETLTIKLEDKELILVGYRTPTWKLMAYVVLCVCTVGLFYLLSRWILKVRVMFLHSKCSVEKAQYVLVEEVEDTNVEFNDEKNIFLIPIVVTPVNRYFVYKGLRYVYEEDVGLFKCYEYPAKGCEFVEFHERGFKPMHEIDVKTAYAHYGPNKMEVPSPTILELFVNELLHPFYIFQIVSVTIWLLQFYFIYASAIFFLAGAGLVFSVMQIRKNNQALADMAKVNSTVYVIREGKELMVDSTEVVPGDLMNLEKCAHNIVCDMVMLDGECVVNEASLTGESVPVIKTPLAKEQGVSEPNFNFDVHSKHVLFCGTELRRIKGNARALVVRTGFHTAKGNLIRQILYPKPSVFPFYRDALVFMLALLIMTLGCFAWSIYKFWKGGATAWFTTLRVMDLFTTVIPPALPIAMSAGASFAVMRLRKNNIYCVIPKTVNVAGRVNIFCFDKTGTLTKDHLDVFCVKPSENAMFYDEVMSMTKKMSPILTWTLAACHSVVKLSPHETIGDPLEVKMMHWSGWISSMFDDDGVTMTSPDKTQVITTLNRNEFLSQLARMSVIVRGPDQQLYALAKGSPEGLRNLCDPRSIPHNFDATLASYTAQGMRTIALGAKKIKSANLQRDQVECDLTFLGFLVMVNPLKEETPPMLSNLRSANIRAIMITGDNALTAVNVARKCGLTSGGETMLVDCKNQELTGIVVHHDTMEHERKIRWDDVLANVGDYDVAMTGNAFSNLATTKNMDFVNTLLRYTNVFARTSPIQKTQIVMTLKDGTKNTVGMVGDGANDCGALKAADCGLSISDGEAAIAAPFSAATISSVVDLLLEGRGALATSFALFKFMILYSIIQTTQVMCAYVFLNLLADTQFLYNDLFLILPLSFSMGLTKPTHKLVAMRPPATLFKPSVVFSVIGHTMFMICFYITAVYWSQIHIWVNPSNQPVTLVNGTTPFISVAVSVIWLCGNMLYVAYSFAFSIGHPFRLPFYYNTLLVLSLVVAFTLNICWFFIQTTGVLSFWQLVKMPYDFLGPLFGFTIGFMVFSYAYELIIIYLIADKEAKISD